MYSVSVKRDRDLKFEGVLRGNVLISREKS
jgi:hypothetical protein